ncbi:hypothetical protein [Flavobacterium turcicum]|uniref:Uncharacterized protein n=1 Tax=Flavobacterium turcicum TaxID=2764718 RepID=A0ABR7JFU5_9FLAO|nr:hypothetical protein [Flavobacterium turcicum]MBC5863372.1 hypothetical protein [Flavobacterium turcicum]NHL02104.1 hypothetical protein [Flavobacterium turcicum]
MKSVAPILLFFFIAFLLTPTVVSLIENDADIHMFYSFSEEEIIKNFQEIKVDLKQNFDYPILVTESQLSSKIISENLSRHDTVLEKIFSPPPEFV